MSDHTPGPWIIQRGPHSDGHFEVGSDDGGGFFTVARVKGFSQHDAKANASLIAAAPELLESAKEAREVLAMAIRTNTPGMDFDPAEHLTIKRLDAAVAKAEGR